MRSQAEWRMWMAGWLLLLLCETQPTRAECKAAAGAQGCSGCPSPLQAWTHIRTRTHIARSFTLSFARWHGAGTENYQTIAHAKWPWKNNTASIEFLLLLLADSKWWQAIKVRFQKRQITRKASLFSADCSHLGQSVGLRTGRWTRWQVNIEKLLSGVLMCGWKWTKGEITYFCFHVYRFGWLNELANNCTVQ